MPNAHAVTGWPEIVTDDVCVHRMPGGGAIAMHLHAQGQLFWLKSGLAVVEMLDGSWLFPPQRCGWIPAGQMHSVRSGGQANGWSLFVAAELCRSLPKRPVVLALSPLLEQMVMRVAEWEESPPTEERRKSFITVLVDEIERAREQPLHLPVPGDLRLKRMVEEMSRRPEMERSLEEWAHAVGMSERSLQREFQRETGMTVGRWRQQLRMLAALEKLSEGISVTETCFSVGYNDVSAFIKAFKKTVGVTPLEYSKSLRE